MFAARSAQELPPVQHACLPISPNMEEQLCFYDFLGVEKGCSCKVALAKAYRRKSVQVHPDKKGGSEALFQRLSKVFRVLSDDELRKIYTAYGEAAVDQHERNLDETLEIDELPHEKEEGDDEEEDDGIPKAYGWREMEDGEAMVRGSTVRMNMDSGQNRVLEKLESLPDESYKHSMQIRDIMLKYDWQVVTGAFLSFTAKSEDDMDVFEAQFTHQEGVVVFQFEIVQHNLFRNDWDGQYAKLYKRGFDDRYVLRLFDDEVWVAHGRKRASEDELLNANPAKQGRHQ